MVRVKQVTVIRWRFLKFVLTFFVLAVCLVPGLTHATIADPYNYLIRNGIHSPVYGELSAHVTDEFEGTNTLLNFQFGIQALRFSEHSIAIGYLIRGFNHGHTEASKYKVKLDGVNLEYLYTEYDWRPRLGISYLIGEKRENETEDKEIVNEMKKFEVQAGLGYFIPMIEGELLLGYNYSMSSTTTFTDNITDKKRVIETVTRDEKKNFSGVVVGLRFSGF
ncbi:MAG: hypothetical protein HYW48_10095 [Deltaproteobacteria bacterium]|nr:hypothetical protein [Deltaproteobacteria bacterium]